MSATLRLSHDVANRVTLAQSMEVLAWIATKVGRAQRAANSFGGIQTQWETIPASLQPHLVPFHDANLADARSALGDREFARAFRVGTQMRIEQLITLALDEKEPTAPKIAERRSTDELDAP